MDYKYIVSALIVIVILFAVIFKDKVKASFMGLMLNSENTKRKNSANIRGENNKVNQGSNPKSTPVDNTAKITGSSNEIDQK